MAPECLALGAWNSAPGRSGDVMMRIWLPVPGHMEGCSLVSRMALILKDSRNLGTQQAPFLIIRVAAF